MNRGSSDHIIEQSKSKNFSEKNKMKGKTMIRFKSNKTNYCKFCIESEKAKIKNVKISYEYENPEGYGYPEVCHWTKDVDIFFCPMCGRKIDGSKIAAAFKDSDVQRIFAEVEGTETSHEES